MQQAVYCNTMTAPNRHFACPAGYTLRFSGGGALICRCGPDGQPAAIVATFALPQLDHSAVRLRELVAETLQRRNAALSNTH